MTKGARRGGKKASADTATDRDVSSANHTSSADGKENKQQGNHQQQLAKAQRNNRRQPREDLDAGTLKNNHTDPHTSSHADGSKSDTAPHGEPHHAKKEPPKPTSEQLMIAQLIGDASTEDLTQQRKKIVQVMDITGKEEDEVATALFDAGWDQNKAVELLLESGTMGEWEEMGKKKKKKATAEDGKEDADESEMAGFQERDRSGRGRGPRLRRGGASQGRGAGGGGDRRGEIREQHQQSDFESAGNAVGGGRGARRGGDQPPRRGGGERGGGAGMGRGAPASAGGPAAGRSFRQVSNSGAANGDATPGFATSIDTWNPSGEGGQGGTSQSGGRPTGRHSNKDPFDNAGNWGDDFPAAEDWDNEEYTGSLADSKVFTPSSSTAQSKMSSIVGGNRGLPQTAASVVSGGGGQQASSQQQAKDAVPNVNVATMPSASVSFSQQIDLTQLLQKPATQTTQSAMLQFSQQATDSLKAAVGIGGPNQSSGKSDLTYAQSTYQQSSAVYPSAPGSAFSAIKPATNGEVTIGGLSQRQAPGSRPQQPQQQQQSQEPGKAPPGVNRPSRMPPTSKIPSSAVEMPGDSLGTSLDVKFGAMDLQFGGSSNSATSGGFDFNGPSSISNDLNEKSVGAAPSAKEVNKALSNAMASGKLTSGADSGFSSQQNKLSSDRQASGSNYSSSRSPAASGLDALGKQGNEGLVGYTNSYYQNQPGSKSQYGQSNNYSNSGGAGNQYYSGSTAQPSSTSSGYSNGGYNSQQQQQQQQSGYASSAAGSRDQSNNFYMSSQQSGGGYKSASNQYQDKYDAASSTSSAALGLTTTTNSLSGKVSATSSGKVSMPNMPPGVAGLMPPYMTVNPGLPFYGLGAHQPQLYSTYGGMEDLAALQRVASGAGLHALVGSAAAAPTVPQPGGAKAAVPTSSYYDPNNQFAAAGRNDVSSGTNSNLNIFGDKGFGGVTAGDSVSGLQNPLQSIAGQQSFNAFAAAQSGHQAATIPPGYAYFYGGVPALSAYGASYPAPAAMTVPNATGASANSQFQQKSAYPSSYYDALGPQGSKDFPTSYSGGAKAGAGGSVGTGAGGAASAAGSGTGSNANAGHQYWGTSAISNNQLW